jgi:PhnB protein
MLSTLNPYLSFEGNARAAMEFYKTVFGGELGFSTFGESGMATNGVDPDGIMHALLTAENGITIMGSDSATGMRDYIAGTNMSLSLNGDNESELTAYYNQLAEGGTVEKTLEKAPWGDTFGMCIDKFGVFWMVNITGVKAD